MRRPRRLVCLNRITIRMHTKTFSPRVTISERTRYQANLILRINSQPRTCYSLRRPDQRCGISVENRRLDEIENEHFTVRAFYRHVYS